MEMEGHFSREIQPSWNPNQAPGAWVPPWIVGCPQAMCIPNTDMAFLHIRVQQLLPLALFKPLTDVNPSKGKKQHLVSV